MNILRDELKKSRNGGYEVIIYLADDQTEFAEELGKGGPDSETKASIINYVKKKYPNLKVTVAKVVLGGVVLGTIPLAGGAAQAAAAGPKDIDKASGFAKEAIVRLVESGTIQGDETGAFNPKGSMTRDAFTSMIVKALVKDADLVNPDTPTFKDVPKTHWAYKYIETAVAKGLITGTGDGSFGPTGQVTREQLATILVRSLGLTADDIKGQGDTLKFADKDAISSFARDSVAFAVNNGLLTGINDSTFNGKGAATREQVAVVVDRYVTNADKLTEAANTIKNTAFKAEASSTNTITLSFTTAVDAFAATDVTVKDKDGKDVKVTNVKLSDDKKSAVVTTDSLTSGASYTVTVTKDAVKGSATVTAPQAAEVAATAAGAKKIQVKFNKAIDTATATFTVKKGSLSQNVSAKTFSDDKTTVTLELSSKLTEGEYTVVVGGVGAKEVTSTFTAANEKVTKIEYLSKTAPQYDAAFDGTPDGIEIAYKVSNQYGENITKATTLTSNFGASAIDASRGVITYANPALKVDDSVPVTLVHGETGVSAVETLKVGSVAKASEISIAAGVYNKDKKTLDEDVNLTTDAFYLLVDVKDQYGNPITSTSRLNADIVINASNQTIAAVPTAAVAHNNGNFTTVTVDGVDRTAIKLSNANGIAPFVGIGTNQVNLISTATGKSATHAVTVATATRAETVNLITPDLFVDGETNYIPIEVLDKNGTAITSLATLNNATKGVNAKIGSTALKIVTKDGITQLEVPDAAISSGANTIIAVTPNNQVKTLTLTAKAAATPNVVRGVDSDFATAMLQGTNKTLAYTDLVLEDQYGRVMSDSAVNAALNYTVGAGTGKRIVVTETTGTNVSLTVGSTASLKGAAGAGGSLAANSFNLTSATTTRITAGGANGSEKLTLSLYDGDTLVNGSSADVTIRVTDGTEYASYSVDKIGTVYDEDGAGNTDHANYDNTVKVYGVLSDGGKVLLTNTTDYTISAPTNSDIDTDVADGTLDVASALTYGTDKTETTVPITVTIASTGQQLTESVTFSKVAPKVSSIKFVGSNSTTASEITSINHTNSTTFNVASLFTATSSTPNVVVTDQYGKSFVVPNTGIVAFGDGTTATAKLTITPVSGTVTIANNGTTSAAVTNINVDDVFDVTVTYGSVTKTIRVTGV
ncbi:S-layer homology domain-containing protein [Paenibacillus methanolicus]|uniref:S-layer family protein n=1 Tax=Paenibacillus methanolicus TaxID=582686 RepID=A0A5S5C8G7_9BACL|nr:S-layer homology domain-containing protein [Paenibacillus methanolicus]TYP75479.1 S-layer family protein [Paenibacillus methanolicus]